MPANPYPGEEIARSYRSAWWLPGAHLQTVWGRIARSRRLVPTRRELLLTQDDDDLLLDHVDGKPGAGRVVFLHGLEGSSNSVYIQGMLRAIARAGLNATVLNFRACAREPDAVTKHVPNRGRRLYHSGETSDLRFVLRMLVERYPHEPLSAIGVSLGGNVLLKYLGETGTDTPLVRAATISVPYDLAAGARHLETGLGKVYVTSFLRSLSRKAAHVCGRHGIAHVDLERGRRATTFREFDDAVTAPLHGFSGADEYYSESSSLGFLSRIRIPVLCISAIDDPFLPPEALDRARVTASREVSFAITRHGGHVGFVGGPPWRPRYWAEQVATEWVMGRVTAGPA